MSDIENLRAQMQAAFDRHLELRRLSETVAKQLNKDAQAEYENFIACRAHLLELLRSE